MKRVYRIGHSNDIHRLVEGRKLTLGGISVPFDKGLLGHSDADCVLHSLAEAILGALALGDLGDMFPDSDKKYEGIASAYFVEEVYKIMDKEGYEINNVDIIIYLEEPHLKDYKALMRENIASLLHTSINNVNVKATRKEKMGPIGEGEAIEAETVVMLKLKDMVRLWKNL